MTYSIYNKTRAYQKSKIKVIVYFHKETYKFFLLFTDLFKKTLGNALEILLQIDLCSKHICRTILEGRPRQVLAIPTH